MLSSALMGFPSVLAGRLDRLGDGDVRRRTGVATDRADERLQIRVAEELLELVGALPFVDDQDEPVAYAEPVVNRARARPGPFADLRELRRPVFERLPEDLGIALDL